MREKVMEVGVKVFVFFVGWVYNGLCLCLIGCVDLSEIDLCLYDLEYGWLYVLVYGVDVVFCFVLCCILFLFVMMIVLCLMLIFG